MYKCISRRTVPLCVRRGLYKGVYREERHPYREGKGCIRVSIVINGIFITLMMDRNLVA